MIPDSALRARIWRQRGVGSRVGRDQKYGIRAGGGPRQFHLQRVVSLGALSLVIGDHPQFSVSAPTATGSETLSRVEQSHCDVQECVCVDSGLEN
jgi:hypothetical protein